MNRAVKNQVLPVKQKVQMNNKRLNLLREKMKEENIDAYIIPITDPHLGEYVPEHWRIIKWLSGFSGSAEGRRGTRSAGFTG